uniref:Cobalamin adenosyltransferase n=1 Tax=Mimivirus LCMiAC01 TaxID=2506608 RepID=A0A481YZ39_9VIRU|nr:MAG: cobalamin adenosyltransferase [Mimivirus LCMiAC01]
MSVVTKGGDHGYTRLYNGEKVPKYHPRIKAIGSVQNLSYAIGKYFYMKKGSIFDDDIITVMCWLYDLGAYLATPRNTISTKDMIKKTEFTKDKEKSLHEKIKWFEKEIPKQTCFIIPIGTELGSLLYEISGKVRETERIIFEAIHENKQEVNDIMPFINRLSDYFYVFARYINYKSGHKDIPYVKNKKMI